MADVPRGPNVLSAERYLAWLYTPAPQQPVFAALCEIENEIAGSLRPGIDHHVAHARLQWWREECERSAQGRAVHPRTRALVSACGGSPTVAEGSALAGISGFVDTAVWDLAGATFETRKELDAYCRRWATAMFETAAGGPEIALADVMRALGAAVREIELLANLGQEAHAGRVRLPLDELERSGADVSLVAKPPWPTPVTALVRARHQALRAAIATGVADLGRQEQERWRGLLVWAALAQRLSLRAENALPNTVPPRRYHALTDGWQAWRAAHRASAGNLRLMG
jgi:phytoene synthase